MVMKTKWLQEKSARNRKGRVKEEEVVSVVALGERRGCEEVTVRNLEDGAHLALWHKSEGIKRATGLHNER